MCDAAVYPVSLGGPLTRACYTFACPTRRHAHLLLPSQLQDMRARKGLSHMRSMSGVQLAMKS